MTKVSCKECKTTFTKGHMAIGAIYSENKNNLSVDYFVCIGCLNLDKHQHKLNSRSGWSHLYGDISGGDREWMRNVTSKTIDTVCGQAGYDYLNQRKRGWHNG